MPVTCSECGDQVLASEAQVASGRVLCRNCAPAISAIPQVGDLVQPPRWVSRSIATAVLAGLSIAVLWLFWSLEASVMVLRGSVVAQAWKLMSFAVPFAACVSLTGRLRTWLVYGSVPFFAVLSAGTVFMVSFIGAIQGVGGLRKFVVLEAVLALLFTIAAVFSVALLRRYSSDRVLTGAAKAAYLMLSAVLGAFVATLVANRISLVVMFPSGLSHVLSFSSFLDIPVFAMACATMGVVLAYLFVALRAGNQLRSSE